MSDENAALADECKRVADDVWKIMPPDNRLRERIVTASKTLKAAAKRLRAASVSPAPADRPRRVISDRFARAAWDAARSSGAESADWVVTDADGVKRCVTCLGALDSTDATAESAATCEHGETEAHYFAVPDDDRHKLGHCPGPVSPLGALPTDDWEITGEQTQAVINDLLPRYENGEYKGASFDWGHVVEAAVRVGIVQPRSFTGTMPSREQIKATYYDEVTRRVKAHFDESGDLDAKIVAELIEDGGWDAVRALFSSPEVRGAQ